MSPTACSVGTTNQGEEKMLITAMIVSVLVTLAVIALVGLVVIRRADKKLGR